MLLKHPLTDLESYYRKADAKVGIIFELPKLFALFFIYSLIFP